MCKDARIVSEVQLAESLDMSLGDLLEGIVLASFGAEASHRMINEEESWSDRSRLRGWRGRDRWNERS